MADLHPIVIPPLQHKFKSVTFTCSGEGLYKGCYSYDEHAEKLLSPKNVKPDGTNQIGTKPAGWWKAQCAFRGLNQSGSIADLQLRLREAKKKMMPELKTAETQLNKEFRKQNKIARDCNWKNLKTAEAEAEANPQKYLSEAFPKTSTGRPTNLDIIVVKTENRAAVAEAADKMGLESVSVDAPWVGNTRPFPDRWIVVGRNRDAVWNKMREIERTGAQSKQDTPKAKEKQTPQTSASESVLSPQLFESKSTGDRTKQTGRKSAPSASTHDSWFDDTENHTARRILPLPQKRRTAGGSASKSAQSTNIHDNLFSNRDSHIMHQPVTEPQKKQTARKSAPSASTHDSWFDDTENHTARQILPLPQKRQTTGRSASKSIQSIDMHDNLSFDKDSYIMHQPVTKPQKKQTARKSAPSASTHPDLFAGDDGDDGDFGQPAAKRARTSTKVSRAISGTTESEGSWDVRGSYVIECPGIEEEWGEKDTELTLDIYIENKNGRRQMFAIFNFIVVEGIMRFERPTPIPRSQNGSGKRKREDSYMDEDGDVLMSDVSQYDTNDSNPNNYKESAFYLNGNDKPTALQNIWKYRWRGEETGEGEIQLGSDRRLESITFSNNGKELSGTFKCDFAGKCKFTGVKVMSRPHDSRIDPEDQWANRSEAVYEYERQARWR